MRCMPGSNAIQLAAAWLGVFLNLPGEHIAIASAKMLVLGGLGADLLNRHVLAGPKASRAYLAMRQGRGRLLQLKAREVSRDVRNLSQTPGEQTRECSALTFPGTSLGRL